MAESENNSLFDIRERVYVVTGASSGIGRAMAGFLCEAGATVIALARRADALESLALELAGASGELIAHPADLSQREAVDDLAASLIARTGKVDGLVNAAGVNLREPADDISLENWDQTLHLNLSTPFFLARALVADMKTRGWGRVINFASLQSARAFANSMAYGASKGGVCQLTRAMAEAWSGDGINCNAIAPGFFPTELTAPVFDDDSKREANAQQTAIGRNGELEDLRGVTLFFASSASDYITGQTLFVDGGFTAK